MKLVQWEKLEETQGNLVLIWGPAGCGKTSTAIQTSPMPIDYITAEKRKVKTTVVSINRPDLKMRVGVYEGFNDCIEKMNNVESFKGSKTIIFDSFTHVMASQLAFEILDQDYESKPEKEREGIIKELTMQVKMSKESYGALADNMLRLMNALQNLCMNGFDVVCTARSEERPKYDKTLSYGPALMGQKFGNILPGYCDFIAMLQSPEHEKDELPPPYDAPMVDLWRYHAQIAFYDKSESYLAKWTGPYPPKGVVGRRLHIGQLLKEANGIYS